MKTFDFTQLGGFPLDQDTLMGMQDNYLASFAGLIGQVPPGIADNFVLSGLDLTSGTYDTTGVLTKGTVIDVNEGIVEYEGGTFNALDFVCIMKETQGLTYADNIVKPSLTIRKIVVIGAVPPGYVAICQCKDIPARRINNHILEKAFEKGQFIVTSSGATNSYTVNYIFNRSTKMVTLSADLAVEGFSGISGPGAGNTSSMILQSLPVSLRPKDFAFALTAPVIKPAPNFQPLFSYVPPSSSPTAGEPYNASVMTSYIELRLNGDMYVRTVLQANISGVVRLRCTYSVDTFI